MTVIKKILLNNVIPPQVPSGKSKNNQDKKYMTQNLLKLKK